MNTVATRVLGDLVGQVVLPEPAGGLCSALQGADGPLVLRALIRDIHRIAETPSNLVIYLRELRHINDSSGEEDVCSRAKDVLINALSSLSQEQVEQIEPTDMLFLLLLSERDGIQERFGKRIGEAMLDERSLEECLSVMRLWQFNGKENVVLQRLLPYFRPAFERFVGDADLERIKVFLKVDQYPKEYQDILLDRADVLLSSCSFYELRQMHSRWTYQRCAFTPLVPIVEKYLPVTARDEVNSQQTAASLLEFIKTYPALDTDECALNRMSALIRQEHSITSIGSLLDEIWREEERFVHVCNLLLDYYRELLYTLLDEPEHVNNAKWLFDRLYQCLHDECCDALDQRLQVALLKLTPKDAYSLVHRCLGYEQLRLCQQRARVRYTRWFSRRVGSTSDVPTLVRWFGIAHSGEVQRRILNRIGRIWKGLSFEDLSSIDASSYRGKLWTLYLGIFREKAGEYLGGEPSAEEVLSVYSRSSNWLDTTTFQAAFDALFGAMSVTELLECSWYMDVPGRFVHLAEERVCRYAHELLSFEPPPSVFDIGGYMDTFRNFPKASSLCVQELGKRVPCMSIGEVEWLLGRVCHSLYNALVDRYREVLPRCLQLAPDADYIHRRIEHCPPRFSGYLIGLLVDIAEENV